MVDTAVSIIVGVIGVVGAVKSIDELADGIGIDKRTAVIECRIG